MYLTIVPPSRSSSRQSSTKLHLNVILQDRCWIIRRDFQSVRDVHYSTLTNLRINAARAYITVNRRDYVFISIGKWELADCYRVAIAADLTRRKLSTTSIALVPSLFTLSHTVNIDTHSWREHHESSVGYFYRRDFPRCIGDYPNSLDYHNKTFRPVNLPADQTSAGNWNINGIEISFNNSTKSNPGWLQKQTDSSWSYLMSYTCFPWEFCLLAFERRAGIWFTSFHVVGEKLRWT